MIPRQNNCGCANNAGPKLIFSCSGGADVGELADLAARKLTREGNGKMFCLAGIGGRISSILKSTKSAASILAIDGCALDCTRKSLEEAGITWFDHLRLTDLGFDKGATAVDADAIDQVVDKAKTFLS